MAIKLKNHELFAWRDSFVMGHGLILLLTAVTALHRRANKKLRAASRPATPRLPVEERTSPVPGSMVLAGDVH